MSDKVIDRVETSWEYTPVSVASAPSGWRAIYKVEKPEPGEPDWMAVPLIGWGVFHLTTHMSAEDSEWSRVVGDVIEGVVIDGMGTPACALMAPNFLFYLGPTTRTLTRSSSTGRCASRRLGQPPVAGPGRAAVHHPTQ